MTDKQLEAYYRYQRFIQIMLTISGCRYMPTKSGKSIFYWSVCVVLLMITYAVLNFHTSYIVRHSIPIMMKCISLALSSCGSIIKVVIFVTNRGTLIKYHQMLNDLFEEELMRNEKIRTIMLSSLYKIRTLAYTYATIMTALFFAYFLPTSLLIIRDLCRLRSPPTSYVLPISRGFGYFWVVPHNYLYHLHFLLEFVIVFVSNNTTGVDSNFGFYVYHFISTMQAMTFRLTNPLPTEKYSDILKACARKHKKLLKCRNTLEHVYGKIIFYYVVSNAVVLCALTYEMSIATEFHFNNLFATAAYALVKLFQIFMYAFYGTLLTNAGEDFRKGIYFGEWPNSSLDRHVRTNVILMMMQKPMTINAIFSTVGVVMFTNLVNTTISYFFLLQSINVNDE